MKPHTLLEFKNNNQKGILKQSSFPSKSSNKNVSFYTKKEFDLINQIIMI